MRTCYGYRVSISGIVLLVLCYGLCVLADGNTVTERRAAGSSLILPLGHPKESVIFAEWKYKEKLFAEYTNGQVLIIDELQFRGRLKVDSDSISVEVTDLQLQDSGNYTIIADTSGVQLPTKTINLTVYGVLNVEIERNQTWLESTNSCEVHLLCRAGEGQSVSYTWSGYKTDSGAQLHFTLSPADGDVTLTCTAASSQGNGTKSTTVKCTENKPPTDSGVLKGPFIWIAAGGGAAAFLLLMAIFVVSCWWRSRKDGPSDSGNTVYADVNENAVRTDKRSDSIAVASIYETVDELRVTPDKPQTLYDKVTFARPTPPAPSPTSPYQHVL